MLATELQPYLVTFIQSLMIAGRQLGFYPQGHPQQEIIIAEVLKNLQTCCHVHPPALTLSCDRHNLLCDGEKIAAKPTSIKTLHQLLLKHDIVTISLHMDLSAKEVRSLLRFLWPLTTASSSSKPPSQRFKELDCPHVMVKFVDYTGLRKDATPSASRQGAPEDIWNELLQQLEGGAAGENQELHAFLTDYIDQPIPGAAPGNEQLGTLFKRLINARYQLDHPQDEKTLKLTQTLSPNVLDTLLLHTVQTLERRPGQTPDMLATLPADAIKGAISRISTSNTPLSARLLDLLGELTLSPPLRLATSGNSRVQSAITPNIDVLLYEDNLDEYVPNQYQQSLHKILNGEVAGTLSTTETENYCQEFKRFNIEKQCCATIFELLDNRVKGQTEQNIQSTLIELSDFFLQTGDFQALQDIFTEWSRYLYSGSSHVLFLEERVLAHHTNITFINDVLDSILVWSKDQAADIVEYISLLGEPYAEQLVNRLAVDEVESHRQLWIKLLIELGSKAHPIILENLERGPWYLIRNLLLILGQQNQAIPMKTILKYTKHEYPQIRKEAIRILAEKSPGIAQRLIYSELTCGDPRAITEICELAEQTSDSRILQQLHRNLQTMPQTDEELLMKKQLLKTLKVIGHPSSKVLMKTLLEIKGFLRPRKHKEFLAEIKNTLANFDG